jgi:hypothetical protein
MAAWQRKENDAYVNIAEEGVFEQGRGRSM